LPPLDAAYRELDGATVHHAGSAWRLCIWGIHQVGNERWIQMSASNGSVDHDLVLHAGQGARTSQLLASIEAWLACPLFPGGIIHVR
jgi:hypothetical protein